MGMLEHLPEPTQIVNDQPLHFAIFPSCTGLSTGEIIFLCHVLEEQNYVLHSCSQNVPGKILLLEGVSRVAGLLF